MAQLKADLFANAAIPAGVEEFLKAHLESSPMDVLRTAVSMLSLYDPNAKTMTPEANLLKATKLMAQTSTIVSSFGRLRTGEAVLAPLAELSFAGNFLYCLTGKQPDKIMEHRQDHGAHVRRGSDAACRPRTERFHVRGTCDGGDALRYLFGGDFRHWRAEGTIAWRGE